MNGTPNHIGDLAVLDEAQAMELFTRLRWPSGSFCCPFCGCQEAYSCKTKTRRIWKCRFCRKQFSATTGTIFASRKMPYRMLLMVIMAFSNNTKGVSSLQMSHDLGINQRSAWRLQKIMREAIHRAQQKLCLTGEVEVDGAFFGGYKFRENAVRTLGGKRRYSWRGSRQIIVVARQRGGNTFTCVVQKEAEAIFALTKAIDRSATIHADGAHAWDSLKDLYKLLRINHAVSYSDGISCTNNAESFFARMRRIQHGVYHRFGGRYLYLYAAEAAWRQDCTKIPRASRWLYLFRILFDQQIAAPLVERKTRAA